MIHPTAQYRVDVLEHQLHGLKSAIPCLPRMAELSMTARPASVH